MRFLRDIIVIILFALVISIIARVTVETREVFHQSMLPTIQPGELVVVSKAAYFFNDPERGDVVILEHPYNSDQHLIKRIIGLPGDSIEIRDNTVFIDGNPLNEPYVMEPLDYKYPNQEIPPNEYFVLGDNRNMSNDSHTGWTVPSENIIGKVWITYWPPPYWKTIEHYDPSMNNQSAMPEKSVSSVSI
jgi:signal peptidase I